MKCGLMQILAVAMVLGHTVLTPGLSMLGHELDTAIETGAHAVLSATRGVRLATSEEVILVNTLHTELDATIQEFTGYNFAHIDNTNLKQVSDMVEKLLDIRKRAMVLTHEYKDALFEKVDNKIDNIVANLQNAEQNVNTYINQNCMYRQWIDKVTDKGDNTHLLSDVDIQWIRDVCNRVDINFVNNEHLSQDQMIELLKRVDVVLYIDIEIKRIVFNEVRELLNHININKPILKHDILDKQTMRNAINIAVYSIVTLCILLLIVVCNRNQTNAGVRLYNWV